MYHDCCKILNVEPGADVDTIKKAYRKQAKMLHPDVNPSKKAGYYFTLLHNAYEYLIAYEEKGPSVTYVNFDIKERRRRYRQYYYSNTRKKRKDLNLSEILKESLVARATYIFIHALFIGLGIYMLIRPIYDAFFVPVDAWLDPFAAYLSMGIAFVVGIILTSFFLNSGISYAKSYYKSKGSSK